MGWAALDAEGTVHALAAVALVHLPEAAEGLGGAERADHDAHPASDAALVMNEDQAFRIAIERLGGTGVQAGGVLAMAALDGKPVIGIRILNPHPGEGRGGFVDRLGKGFGPGGPVERAGNLAALA